MDSNKPLKTHIKPLENGSFEICMSEIKAFYFILSAFIFLIVGLYFFKYPMKNVAYVFLAGFVASSAMALFKVLSKRVILNVNKDFIVFHHPITKSVEKIIWDDVVDFRELRVNRERFIAIDVKDPEHIIETQENKITYKLMRLNYKAYGSPILIPTNMLNAHHKEVLTLLRDMLEEHNSISIL